MFSLIYTQNIVNKKKKKALNSIVCTQIAAKVSELIRPEIRKTYLFVCLSRISVMSNKIETKIKDTLKDLTISTSAFSLLFSGFILADEIPKI